MPFSIVRQDITQMQVDAIANAANTELRMGGGVCGAIFRAAGPSELQAACDALAPIHTGDAVITPGFALPARYVIHAAGPVYDARNPAQSEQLLRAAYTNSLKRAVESGSESVAFPLISSGIYGYPREEALRIATEAIRAFLDEHDLEVYLVVYDRASFVLSERLLGDVQSYIDEHYVEDHWVSRRDLLEVERRALDEARPVRHEIPPTLHAPAVHEELQDLLGNLDEPFSTTLLRLIDARGRTDVDVYKRANLDRKLFSKIRTVRGYTPSKRTVLALAVALELSLAETNDLLRRAGYALSPAHIADVIVEYFIVNRDYDIYEINEALFFYDQPLLGG